MDFFRRIFSKPDEGEIPDKHVVDSVEPSPPSESTQDGIDPSTRPVATTPLPTLNFGAGTTRPLPPEMLPELGDKGFALLSDRLTFGQSTDVGQVRSNNQDSCLSFFFSSRSSEKHIDFGLFVVADGMGGHQDGEKASAIATRVIAAQIMNTVYLPLISQNNDGEDPPIINEAMVTAVQKANSEVIRYIQEGGTTVTAITIIDNMAHVAHVGDSRAYILSKEGMEQITRDHSLVQRLIELDQLTRSEADAHPQKNVLYRALGQNEQLEVDTLTRRLQPNSRVLICSDGLWGYVEEKDIFEIVMNTPDPQMACDKLIAQANARGGMDNITAILLKLSGS